MPFGLRSSYICIRILLTLIVTCIGIMMLGENRAFSHTQGENYVWINVDPDRIYGRFEIHENDLKEKLGLDVLGKGDGQLAAIEKTADVVNSYIKEHFQLIVNGKDLPYQFTKTQISTEAKEYIQYYYSTDKSAIPSQFSIKNSIFISPKEPLHRSLVVLEFDKKTGKQYDPENAIMVFGPHNEEQTLNLEDVPSLLEPGQFLWQGVLHIWIGLDHILFLIALLFMSVVIVQPTQGASSGAPQVQLARVSSFAKAAWNVLKIVTIFTVAHSITLSLAALGLLDVNSRVVESLIALSIVFVALNNVFQIFNDRRWLFIFFFGLFHGMGFASVMGELPFRTVSLLHILINFNIGIELGQLAIVAVVFPALYLLSGTRYYQSWILRGGSVVIGVIAFYWFVERAFGL